MKYRIVNAEGKYLTANFSNGKLTPFFVASEALAYTYTDKQEAARIAEAFNARLEVC